MICVHVYRIQVSGRHFLSEWGKAVICPGVTTSESSRGSRNDSINVALLPDSLVSQRSNPNGTFGSKHKILWCNVMGACWFFFPSV